MKLLMVNGSPKPSSSNTQVMIDAFAAQINKDKVMDTSQENWNVASLKLTNQNVEDVAGQMKAYDHIVIAMPLYGYSMPAQVLELLNLMHENGQALQGKSIGYIVQYGFIEAVHARPLEKYFIDYTEKISAKYMGTIIKGGCDNLLMQKDKKQGKDIIKALEEIALDYKRKGVFNAEKLKAFSAPEIQKKKSILFMKLMVWFANRYYWKAKFEKNGVSEEESFAKPYTE